MTSIMTLGVTSHSHRGGHQAPNAMIILLVREEVLKAYDALLLHDK